MLLQELSRSRIFDTLRQMERLQCKFNHLLESPFNSSSEFPRINLWMSDDAAHLTAEIPGVDANDVEISIVNDTLTLRGTRSLDGLDEGQSLHRRERSYGEFTRTIQLPFKVETDKAEATHKRGILTLRLPRAEQDKPRKISVRAN